jgi:hypothetical protein
MLPTAVSLILVMISLHGWALDSETNRSTLQGLSGVRVLVEDVPPELEREGLTKDRLQGSVELKLRTAGIKPFTEEECRNAPGEPYLYININLNTLKPGSNIYSYGIDIGLIQDVILQRSPKQTSYAITWSTGGVGLIGGKQLGELGESVGGMVDLFIMAFLSVNPKK